MRPWLAFRVDFDRPCDAPVGEHLWPWLRAKQAEGLLGRWFFLWYSEGGHHLRLRLQPQKSVDSKLLARELRGLSLSAEGAFRLRRQLYDRSELAFGENRESVLAELLHVATSELSLRLLSNVRAEHAPVRKAVMAAAAASVWVRRALGPGELGSTFASWRRFAAHNAVRWSDRIQELDPDGQRAWGAALNVLIPQMQTAFDSEKCARDAIALLRRVHARGARGRFVAIHALHLFCNEIGIGFGREYQLASALLATVGQPCTAQYAVSAPSETPA
jgi:thiopeptide-type bacteriocin biosynthesis protein